MLTEKAGKVGRDQMRLEDLLFFPLSPFMLEDVRSLCVECFPISYPDSWFSYVLSERVYSLGAFTTNRKLVGMVIAEIQPIQQIESEIGPVLDSVHTDTTAMYILSLGVLAEARHSGIGSRLINSVLRHVSQFKACHLVYLHVLASNTTALEFYRKLGFSEVYQIPNYYFIQNQAAAGLVYCYYSNGGQPFNNTFTSCLRRYMCEGVVCGWVAGLYQWLIVWAQTLNIKKSTF